VADRLRHFQLKISIFVFPLICDALLTGALCVSFTMQTQVPYRFKATAFAIALLLFWTIAFAWTQRRISMGYANSFGYVQGNTAILLILFFCIAYFFVCSIWNSGYLSLEPVAQIDNGQQHVDTLFHSAISESFSRSLFPSTLTNEEVWFRYHTFSHLLINLLSRLLTVPCFLVYNYFYPIVFIPIYALSQVCAIACAKEYFHKKNQLEVFDILVIAFLNISILTKGLETSCGHSTFEYICSESFLIACTILLFFFALSFKAMQKAEWKQNTKALFLLVVIPLFEIAVSWAKISVGFIFATLVIYYFFRVHIRALRYWCLNIYYGCTFLGCLILFEFGKSSAPTTSKVELFAYARTWCEGVAGGIGYYLVLSSMALLFVASEIRAYKFKWNDFRMAKTLWIEVVLVSCAASFLPGLILKIPGGSASYFSDVAEFVAMPLLCGFGIDSLLPQQFEIKRRSRLTLYLLLTVWCIFLTVQKSPALPTTAIAKEYRSNLYGQAMDLRNIAGKHPEKYTIYVDDNIEMAEVFSDNWPQSKVFFYPALTGIGVINATYLQDGQYYNFIGEPVANYGLELGMGDKMTLEQAIQVAKERGKATLLHITRTGYEAISLFEQ
jgi:hypothetical protein